MNKLAFFAVYLLIFLLFSAKNIFSMCKIYLESGFDSGALFAWDYASLINMQPIKDIFYPYGFFYYMRDRYIFTHVFYFLTLPLLMLFIFVFLKKIWRSHIFAYVAFFLFALFTWRFVGFDAFYRYGIIIVFGGIYSLVLYKKKISSLLLFILGFINGFTFAFINDQGIYAITLFIFLWCFSLFYKKSKALKQLLFFLFGVSIGLLPFYLHFFESLLSLRGIFLYSKTPFFNYVKSPENFFTFGILIFAILYLSYRFFYKKDKLSFNTYFQLSLIFILILLEQKNIMRSISTQITFVSLLLFFSILASLYRYLEKKSLRTSYFIVCLIFICVFVFVGVTFKPIKSFYSYVVLDNNACLRKNIKNFITRNYDYQKVKNYIDLQKNTGKNIFSFPADPIFYIINDQNIPFYSNIYDASSFEAQDKQIEYIEINNVQFVIYNTEIIATQDNVPDVVRGTYLLSYVLTNFSPVDKIGEFLIFKKNSDLDFFENELINTNTTLKDKFLNIDLQSIPKSEGIYKTNFIKDKSNILLPKRSFVDLNKKLLNSPLESKNRAIIVWNEKMEEEFKKISITLETEDSLKSIVHFIPCIGKTPCIINLKRLPLFYRNRKIKKIMINSKSELFVEVRDKARDKTLW